MKRKLIFPVLSALLVGSGVAAAGELRRGAEGTDPAPAATVQQEVPAAVVPVVNPPAATQADEGAQNDSDDAKVGDVDNGAQDDVDEGAQEDADDGKVGDVDDGEQDNVDDGQVGDVDHGEQDDVDDGDSGDGAQGNRENEG